MMHHIQVHHAWRTEVAIEDAKQLFGTGQARNRTSTARSARTVPFDARLPGPRRLLVRHRPGTHPADVAGPPGPTLPGTPPKAQPSTAGMAAKLRRVIIAARFRASLAPTEAVA